MNDVVTIGFAETICDIIDTSAGPSSRDIRALEDAFDASPSSESLICDFHESRPQILSPRVSMSGHRPTTRSMSISPVPTAAQSRLHTFYGLTFPELASRAAKGPARRLVYDWSMTDATADFGPFHKDSSGTVNWPLLEACSACISWNFEMVVDDRWPLPVGFRYSVPYLTLTDPTIPEDWARVTGQWFGTYSFLDYHDLFHYNVGYREGSRPLLDQHDEAHGDLMSLNLKLDPKVETDWRMKSSLPICDDLPPLYFSGTSQGYGGSVRPLIGVRGRVNLCPGGREVRWRFLISYGGGDQWQLEGVQPGGVRSSGIFGLWSHCDHEDNGPVGPYLLLSCRALQARELSEGKSKMHMISRC